MTRLGIQTRKAKLLVICLIAVSLTAGASDTRKKTPVNKQAKPIFESNCATCHGKNGAGTPLGKTLEAADLRSPSVQNRPDAELVEAVSKGKGNMPPFKGKLTDEQIQSLISYVRSFGSSESAK